MGKSHKDQRLHRRKVNGTKKGLVEHKKRDKRRHRNKYARKPKEPDWQALPNSTDNGTDSGTEG